MKALIGNILKNVLSAFYPPFAISLLIAAMAMYFYLFSTTDSEAGKGWKNSIKVWIKLFISDVKFRRLYALAVYGAMILSRTLVNRSLTANPLAEVWGSWGIYRENSSTGELMLTTESIENLMLFAPFIFLLLLVKYTDDKKIDFGLCFKQGLLIGAKLSFAIEFTQLFLRVGSFQLSDLFYNILGAGIGGAAFFLTIKIKQCGK